MPLFEARGVTKRFGGLTALHGVDFALERGIASIIGPNGAGKTTLFNVFTGLYVPDEGSVTFRGQALLGLRPDQITTLGVCRTFQNIRLFANMTPVENVLVGMNSRIPLGLWDVLSHNPRFRRSESDLAARALGLLDRVGLQANANIVARNLPYGDRRRLELARALASEPALLLLDEPTAGMTQGEAGSLMRLLRGLVADLELATIPIEHEPLVGVPAHAIVARGVAHVPEGRRIFNRLTVRENLTMGAYLRSDAGIAADLDRVFALFPRLAERLTQVAGTLSGGEQQMLAIGRALMATPRLLLLDEPSMGLAPVLVEQIFDTISDINRGGMTILLVEQNAAMALSIAHRGYVLETGSIALEGTAPQLSDNADVRRAYLRE